MIPSPTLLQRLRNCGIEPEEVREMFARSSGAGGQHVNKVETAVRLVHPPSGLEVNASESRSREMNRRVAWLRLAEAAERGQREKMQSARALAAKKRRQLARRSRASKQKLVEHKRHRSKIREQRRWQDAEG